MRFVPIKFFIACALAVCTSTASSVSFDCAKASSFSEKAVCTDALLGRLDDALAENFQSMLASDLGGSKSGLRAEQKKWLVERERCTTVKCLIDMYRKRVDATCEYGVVSGVHPVCTMSEDIK